MITKEDSNFKIDRKTKDLFDSYEDYKSELNIYNNVISASGIVSSEKNQGIFYFTNRFNEASQLEFNKLLNDLVDK